MWKMLAPSLVFAILAVPAAGVQQPESLRETVIIELRHRLAEQIIPVLLPHVAADAVTLSGSGNRLIIRSPSNLIGQVKELIDTADHPRRQLMITVAAGVLPATDPGGPGPTQSPGPAQGSGSAADATTYRTKRRDLIPSRAPDPGPSPGVRTRDRIDDQDIQQIAVLEGEWARILGGPWGADTRYPVEVRATDGVRVFLHAARENSSRRAFSVRAFLFGHGVTVDIAYLDHRMGDDGTSHAQTRTAETSLKGEVGQWLLVIPAGFSPHLGTPAGPTLGTAPRRAGPPPIWVRIEGLEN